MNKLKCQPKSKVHVKSRIFNKEKKKIMAETDTMIPGYQKAILFRRQIKGKVTLMEFFLIT